MSDARDEERLEAAIAMSRASARLLFRKRAPNGVALYVSELEMVSYLGAAFLTGWDTGQQQALTVVLEKLGVGE